MSLKARITEDMKAAMRAGEKDRLSCIRMLQAGIKQREVDERIELDDAQVLAVIDIRRIHEGHGQGHGRAETESPGTHGHGRAVGAHQVGARGLRP